MPQEEENQPGKFEDLYKQIESLCDEVKIDTALFLGLESDSKELLIWYKGSQLDAARMAAFFTRIVKSRIAKDLET